MTSPDKVAESPEHTKIQFTRPEWMSKSTRHQRHDIQKRISQYRQYFDHTQIKINADLSPTQKQEILNLVYEYSDCFAWTEKCACITHLLDNKIVTTDSNPVYARPFPVP